jgi:hypothetical protein
MAFLGRKRKSARISGDTTPSNCNTVHNVDATTFKSTSKVAKKRRKKEAVVVESRDEHPALTYQTPSNPQATFEGLPAELRLDIYEYLCDSTIIHVHKHSSKTIAGDDEHINAQPTRFTWTPCRLPNPKSPLLCANPKWSGLCKEEDRCTYKKYSPPEPLGFWALAASSKAIRIETQDFFLRRTVISIHPENLRPWLDHLAEHTPQQIGHLRRITLASPNTYRCVVQSHVDLLRERVPNLEGVGFQSQDPIWRWVRSYHHGNGIELDRDAWKRWSILEWMQSFDSSVTIALEAVAWCKHHHWHNGSVGEQQFAVRVFREGKANGEGWNADNVEVEIEQPGKLAERKENAKWRAWWRAEELKGMS